jgi:hypothetical protein
MPGLEFYAGAEDVRAIIEMVFRETDCHVYDPTTRPRITRFQDAEPVMAAFLTDKPVFFAYHLILSLWAPSWMRHAPKKPDIWWLRGQTRKQGPDDRQVLSPMGTMSLSFGLHDAERLTPSMLGFKSVEQGMQLAAPLACRWERYVERGEEYIAWIRSNLQASEHEGLAVLRDALRLAQSGVRLDPEPEPPEG